MHKNPEEKLEQLRRSSLIEFEHLKSPNHPKAPLRELPEHSVDLGNEPDSFKSARGKTLDNQSAGDDPAITESPSQSKGFEEPPGYFALVTDKNPSAAAAGTPADMPLFKVPDFGNDAPKDELDDAPKLPHEATPFPPQEEALSPAQTRS